MNIGKFFMIKKDLNSSLGWNAGRSFVKISEGGELKYLGGDKSYFNLLNIEDGIPSFPEGVKSNYNLSEINWGQFNIFFESYKKNVVDKFRNKRVHSCRKLY